MGGHRKRVLEPHCAFILERIHQTPHLSLHGLKDELAARGVKVSHDTVWQFLRREGPRFKKDAVRPEQACADIARRHAGAPGRPVSTRDGWSSSTGLG